MKPAKAKKRRMFPIHRQPGFTSWRELPEELHEDDIRLVFQNVNDITTFDYHYMMHAEIQSNNMRLSGHLTGMSETKNVNWRTFYFL